MTEISFRRLARTSFIVAVAAAALGWQAASVAQVQMYPGEDVTVNPWAVPKPFSEHKLPPVHLHPPRAVKPVRSRSKRTRPLSTTHVLKRQAPKGAKMTAARVHAPASGRHQAHPVPPNATAIPFSFGTTHVSATAPMAASPGAPPAPSSLHPAAPAAATPPIAVPKGLSKQASVLFNRNSFALSDNTTATLNDLAFSLKTALASGASRVELVGYGGNPGSTSSSARRLSLERALAVRQALIADGVPAERIDVQALGGVPANDHGATDRVDIFIQS